MDPKKQDRLYLLDKCTDGKMTNYRELTGALFDDMQILYNAIHPFLETVHMEALSYVKENDRSVTFLMRTKETINIETIILPANVPVKVEDCNVSVHIPLTYHTGGEDD